jgi:hypothetical protein
MAARSRIAVIKAQIEAPQSKDAEHFQQDDDADWHAAEPKDDAFHEATS